MNERRWFNAIVLSCVLFFSFQVIAVPSSIKVCMMDTDLFPLWRKPLEESADFPGVNIELQQRVAQRLGHSIEWVRAPFPRCLILLQQNKVDLLNAASYSPDREKYGFYPKDNGNIDHSKRLKSDIYKAYVNKESRVFWDGTRFLNVENKPIGIEIGASIRKFLNEQSIPVYEVSRVSQAFGMLALGRVSAVVTNQFNGLAYSSDNIIELPIAVSNRSYFIMVSKAFFAKYPGYANRIWEQSEQAREEHYSSLLERYSQFEQWP